MSSQSSILRFSISALFLSTGASLWAASHSDAPLTVPDPSVNHTDVYAFVSDNEQGQKSLDVSIALNPQEDPGNGIIYYKFADDVQYSIHIAKSTSGTTELQTEPEITYNFRFNSSLRNTATAFNYGIGTEAGPIESSGDNRQNLLQRFEVDKVTRTPGGGRRGESVIVTPPGGYLVPPPNVGPKTTPRYYATSQTLFQGARSEAQLDLYTRQSIYTLADGCKVFAGQRDDGFYADTAGIFDLLNLRNPGKDSFAGFNVQVIELSIPLENLLADGESPVVGVFSTTSRERTKLLRNLRGNDLNGSRKWVQVSRMGNPLFNEVLVAQQDKDRYNQDKPARDKERYAMYARNPEIAAVLNLLLGTNFQTKNRTDLVAIYIPDMLKVDTSTQAVPLAGEPQFDRRSVFGGDTVFSPFQNKEIPSGWPNGRRLGDDVVDIALTAVASGPDYDTITPVGDNVNNNDVQYNLVFPYAPTPDGGPTSSLHEGAETIPSE